ncbi:chromatin remodeling complex Adenosinetriphosphatase [Mycoemilia scoparia]|uniref:Chromatin remodeling complex Adenosinetriphosphatase n=1 Tax=Mycoemilia scoparia TaxID=417184 RepID=A0A9W7ZWR7_9FUNG|nr:chromatin remodeling complex Adenosinetriphosphatase [Mycoemilia scoparia]
MDLEDHGDVGFRAEHESNNGSVQNNGTDTVAPSELPSELPSDEESSESSSALSTCKAPLDPNQVKRFAFLLSQSDVFSHFIQDYIKDDNLKREIANHLRREQEKSKGNGASRRHRKTEKEEDAEMLQNNEDELLEEKRVFTESPTYVKGGTMRDYQLRGLNWMISLYENGINGILADEMGLGKTLQVISFIGFLKHYRNEQGPHLVVVPKSTLHNWKSEFNRWVPDLNVVLLHGNSEKREEIIKTQLRPNEYNCCITTYEMCLICKAYLKKIGWNYIVIDEAHRIKNENSSLSRIMRVIPSQRRLLITGTPLQNNLHELWALLNFLLPDVFGSANLFDAWFQNNESKDQDQELMVQQLHKVLQPFLLRRVKRDVEHSLLPKKEINLYTGLTDMQRQWYRRIIEKDIMAINGATGKREAKNRLQNVAMQLRKCCNHPYLFDGAEPGPPYTTDEHLVFNAGKMKLLDKLLKKMQEKGSRVLIFSQMSRMLDILEDYLMFRGYKYCRIDGSTEHEDRVNAIDDYNRPGSDKFIFLLTTRAGGLGINLVTADIVVLYDSDWNPQADLQAMDRAHRIGQTKQVYVFRFITENAIEEKVIERAMHKLRLDQLVIQQGRLSQQPKAATREELLNMVQFGAKELFNNKDGDNNGEDGDNALDFDAIMRRGESKTAELQSKYADLGLDDLNRFITESHSTQTWEGEDYSNKRPANVINLDWLQPDKRKRKVNYAVDDYYREALRQGPSKSVAQKPPKPPKQIQAHDFQFYSPRLRELLDKEVLAYRKSIDYKIPKGDKETEEDIAKRKEEQRKIDEAEPLTEEEIAEKEKLSQDGFEDWNRRDFTNFVKALERYGRNNINKIMHDVEGKDPKRVKEYHKVFWSRYKELADADRLISAVERGEARLSKQQETQQLLTQKIKGCTDPMRDLRIPYSSGGASSAKGKMYSENEDRFMIIQLERLGYGSEDIYENIRTEFRHSPLFRFDWFIKSRNALEIQRRCQTLIGLLQKEIVGTGGNDE